MSKRGAFLLVLALCAIGWLSYAQRDHAAGWVIERLEARFPRASECEAARAEGSVVLGGALGKLPLRELPGLGLSPWHERITRAAALANKFPQQRIIYSGAESEDPVSILESLGVSRTRITWESHSRNTIENAVFSYGLIRPRASEWWSLVTSAYHMPRAVGLFRAAGFNVIPVPVGFVDELPDQYKVEPAWRETSGLLYNRAHGNSDAIFPGPGPSTGCLQISQPIVAKDAATTRSGP